jgi:predicted transposase YbfD/YdcC
MHLEELQSMGICEAGAPSHDTYGDVFRWLDPEIFNQKFLEWTAGLVVGTSGMKVIVLDGKSLRGSKEEGKSAVHLVNAFAAQARIVMGQQRADGRGGELKAMLSLLGMLNIKDSVVTCDAAGTHRELIEVIRDRGADYIVPVKGNQPKLLNELESFRDAFRNLSQEEQLHEATFHRTEEYGHGRTEIREIVTLTAPDYMTELNSWKDCRTITFVTRTRVVKGKTATQDLIYLSSMSASAEELAGLIRSEWAIENGLHWHLDVSYREDKATIRKDNGPANMSMVRKIAHNILKTFQDKRLSIRCKQIKAGASWPYLMQVLDNLSFLKN